MHFPKTIQKVTVPPIKCQGIKTKLIPFIGQNIEWDGKGKWIEPFLGSGVVAFNMLPQKALLCDTNKHIIKLYQSLQNGSINGLIVRERLESMGKELENGGIDYYYTIRKRFNALGDSVDFLFLNRSCFNGLMRFNSKGGFNVPFGHKPNRFSKAYITKIVNQVNSVQKILEKKNWVFKVQDWAVTIGEATEDDFVYLDPPYIGRSTDYYNTWAPMDAQLLANVSYNLPCKYALSMWLENKYRKNEHIANDWNSKDIKTMSHFYHLGSTESLRNEMIEALVLG
ncbi:MAG TPA: Dam family site-specific DNA-(adenine-N6)-methyltransferase [Mucilaginibacter sp.]|nr:Dam family site-specific DNA-(adenine-N6)-methyltransferase [Mucilaginibacter sp.]